MLEVAVGSGWIITTFMTGALGFLGWKFKKLSDSNELNQRDLDKSQDENIREANKKIDGLRREVFNIKARVDLHEELKMSEAQTREIISDTIEPLFLAQQKSNDKLDEVRDLLVELAIKVAGTQHTRRDSDGQ